VVSKSLNPEWDQKKNRFLGEMPGEGGCLLVEVWDHDMIGSDDFLGEVVIKGEEAARILSGGEGVKSLSFALGVKGGQTDKKWAQLVGKTATINIRLSREDEEGVDKEKRDEGEAVEEARGLKASLTATDGAQSPVAPPPPLPLQASELVSNTADAASALADHKRAASIPALVQLSAAKAHPMGDSSTGTVLFVMHRSINSNTIVYKVNHSTEELRVFWMMFDKVNGKVKGKHASLVQGDDSRVGWPKAPTEELTKIERSTAAYGATITPLAARSIVPPTPIVGATAQREVVAEVQLSALKGRTIRLVRCTHQRFSNGFADEKTPSRGQQSAVSSFNASDVHSTSFVKEGAEKEGTKSEGAASSVTWEAVMDIGEARDAVIQAIHIEFAGGFPLPTTKYIEIYGRGSEYEIIEKVVGSGEAARAEAARNGWGTA
jgi:hypothetical protein